MEVDRFDSFLIPQMARFGDRPPQLRVALVMAGREEEARSEAAEVLRIDPKFSTERFIKAFPWKDQSRTDRVLGAARKTGLT